MRTILSLSVLVLALAPSLARASEGGTGEASHGAINILALLAVGVVLAKIAGALAERCKMPSVLGELAVGVALGVPMLFGWNALDYLHENWIVALFAELGVIILLFQVGLESNLQRMREVGKSAFLVACLGVAAPFAIGYFIVGPWLMPNETANAHLFLAATLTATSVGITARVFKDLNIMKTRAAQVVIGAAVIDDVLGLVILAVVSGVVETGSIGVGAIAWISAKAVIFLVASIILGRLLAPRIGKWLSSVHTGVGMKMAFALAFCFGYAALAKVVGLEPIVGAFAAGLLLDPVHFHRFDAPGHVSSIKRILGRIPECEAKGELEKELDEHHEKHIEDLIEKFGYWFVPIFFLVTGFQVNLGVFADSSVLLVAGAITVAAIIGKLVSGFVAGKGASWKVVGVGMIPRGEVGLIFAGVGKKLEVVNDQAFAAIVIMVILTTVITPIVLSLLVPKKASAEEKVEPAAA